MIECVVLCWCVVLAVQVCLSTCGLLRRNCARLREMADSRVLATSRRIHIRRRVAVLRDSSHFRRFRPAGGGEASRAWHLWSSSARCSGSRPHSRSLRRRSRRLRGDTRRNASSPGYRLLALRRVSPRIRRTASLHVAQFGTRPLVPCLTFHKVHFSFAASALADVPSARLTLPAANFPRMSASGGNHYISPHLYKSGGRSVALGGD